MHDNPYISPVGSPQHVQQQPMGHSILGIISTIVAVIGGGMFIVMIILAVAFGQSPEGLTQEKATIIGLITIGAMFLLLVGGILGLIGVLLPKSKKLFAIIGLVFNGLILMAIIGLMILGSVVQA